LIRSSSSLALSWFVNTNEDVGDFRVELASLSEAIPRTVLVKDIGYNTRYWRRHQVWLEGCQFYSVLSRYTASKAIESCFREIQKYVVMV
jgi:hypothetical protein